MSSYKIKLFNLKKSQYILYIMILTLVMVFIWIGGTLLTSQRNSDITAETKEAALPLNPNIEVQTLIELQNKRVFSAEELRRFPIFMIDREIESETEVIIPIEIQEEVQVVPPVFETNQNLEVQQEAPVQTPIDQGFVPQPLDFESDGPPIQ